MFIIHIPELNYNKIHYIFKVLLEVWADLKPVYLKHEFDYIEISSEQGIIRLHSEMFNIIQERKLVKEDLNVNDIEIENISTKILFESDKPALVTKNGLIEVNADIIGSAFFLLTGYESAIHNPLDKHGRFEAKNSLIEDVIDKPVVHDYCNIILSLLRKIHLNIDVPKNGFKVIPTHDVDHPTEYMNLPLPHMLKNCAGDVILRKNSFIPRLLNYAKSRSSGFADPFYTFDYMLDQEKDFESIYYFFFGSFGWDNPSYRIDEFIPLLEKIRKQLNSNIGIHFGLGTYNNNAKMISEMKKAISLVPELLHSRQHYLALNIPETMCNLSESGIKMDSTFAFRDKAGFRCGACRPFPLYDFVNDKLLGTWEKPLILMESQIIDNSELTCVEKAEKILSVKNTVKKYEGEFVFLWHNHRLVEEKEKRLYEIALKG